MREPNGEAGKPAVICPPILCILLSVWLGAMVPPSSPADEPRLELAYRSLQPGEVILIELTSQQPVQDARLFFAGELQVFGRGGEDRCCWAYLGLDMALAPGDYPLEAWIRYPDGSEQTLRRELRVVPKVFPIRRLTVDEMYVTPPPRLQDRIRAEADLLRTVFAMNTPVWMGEGDFAPPTEGTTAANFGERRVFNDQPRSPHSGVDISSPSGTPVRASNGGRVVLAKALYFAGNAVVIDHGLGVLSFYGHLSRIHVKEGDEVRKGEAVGEVGATGRVTGPHLHWSVRIRGARVDPLSLLSLKLPRPPEASRPQLPPGYRPDRPIQEGI